MPAAGRFLLYFNLDPVSKKTVCFVLIANVSALVVFNEPCANNYENMHKSKTLDAVI